jgi:hypothetical protein
MLNASLESRYPMLRVQVFKEIFTNRSVFLLYLKLFLDCAKGSGQYKCCDWYEASPVARCSASCRCPYLAG